MIHVRRTRLPVDALRSALARCLSMMLSVSSGCENRGGGIRVALPEAEAVWCWLVAVLRSTWWCRSWFSRARYRQKHVDLPLRLQFFFLILLRLLMVMNVLIVSIRGLCLKLIFERGFSLLECVCAVWWMEFMSVLVDLNKGFWLKENRIYDWILQIIWFVEILQER